MLQQLHPILTPPESLTPNKLQLLKEEAGELFTRINSHLVSYSANGDSFTGGNLGLMIYYFTLYKAFDNETYAKQGLDILYGIFERINTNQTMLHNYSFAKGICGLNRCIQFLIKDDTLPADIYQEIKAFDDILFEEAKQMIPQRRNDFLHSSLGILSYFSERLPDAAIEKQVEILVDLLLENTHETDEFCWNYNIFTETQDRNEINMSLSHGQCSFLIILLQLFQKA